MKVVILAGGFGTRLSEYTDSIPKPMVPIGNKPIIEHIIDKFCVYGIKNFFISAVYKSRILKSYFYDLKPQYNVKFLNVGIKWIDTCTYLHHLEHLNGINHRFYKPTIGKIIYKGNYTSFDMLYSALKNVCKNDNSCRIEIILYQEHLLCLDILAVTAIW